MCESTTSSSSMEQTNSVDSQASAVSLHVLTTSSQLSPLVTASSVSALSPTGKPSTFVVFSCFFGINVKTTMPALGMMLFSLT